MPGSFIYRNWDGTQQIMPFDADAVMEAISDDLLADGDLRRALRRLMQQGYQTRDNERMMGLRDLTERLRQRRQQMLRRHDMNSLMDDIAKQVDEIVQEERQHIENRLDESRQQMQQKQAEQQAGPDDQMMQKMLENMAAKRQQQLDQLPESPAGQIKELQDYEF